MPKGVYERTKPSSRKGIIQSNYPTFWIHGKHQEHLIAGRQKLKLPPLDILNWIFRYDSETGKLFRIRKSSGKVLEPEMEITTVGSHGYKVVNIKDSSGVVKLFLVHQLCYFMHSGVEPLQLIDHINGDKLDNLFSNLRLANQSVNQRNRVKLRNNTSGITGVVWCKSREKWVAQAHDNSGKHKHLGRYLDKEIAAKVISEHYANPVNGYTSRHGL